MTWIMMILLIKMNLELDRKTFLKHSLYTVYYNLKMIAVVSECATVTRINIVHA